MKFTIPIRTVAVMNGREHWTVRRKRVQRERDATRWVWISQRPEVSLPCRVMLTRIAPRPLDSHDNLAASLKAVVDQLAVELGLPVNKKGHAQDSDPRVTWAYAQRKGGVREYAVEAEITSEQPAAGHSADLQVKESALNVPRETSEAP